MYLGVGSLGRGVGLETFSDLVASFCFLTEPDGVDCDFESLRFLDDDENKNEGRSKILKRLEEFGSVCELDWKNRAKGDGLGWVESDDDWEEDEDEEDNVNSSGLDMRVGKHGKAKDTDILRDE
jgi:hypothetical protein